MDSIPGSGTLMEKSKPSSEDVAAVLVTIKLLAGSNELVVFDNELTQQREQYINGVLIGWWYRSGVESWGFFHEPKIYNIDGYKPL